MATIMLAKLNANAHESIHILMEDIGDFVAFQTTCHLCFVFVKVFFYNIQFGQQHDSF